MALILALLIFFSLGTIFALALGWAAKRGDAAAREDRIAFEADPAPGSSERHGRERAPDRRLGRSAPGPNRRSREIANTAVQERRRSASRRAVAAERVGS